MVTKLKKFSRLKATKILMALIGFVVMLLGIFVCFEIIKSETTKYGTGTYAENTIKSYDTANNTDYYINYVNSKRYLENEIKFFDDIHKITEDNFNNSVHEILGIDLQDSIDKGFRYILLDQTEKVIGTDGITNKNVDYWNYFNINQNITISEYGITVYKNNSIYDGYNKGMYEEYMENSNSSLENSIIRYYSLIIFYEDSIGSVITQYGQDVVNDNNKNLLEVFIYAFIFLLVCLYFSFVGGMNNSGDKVKVYVFDKIYIEIIVICTITLTIVSMIFLYTIFEIFDMLIISYIYYASYVIATVLTINYIYLFSNLGKKIRLKTFLDSFLIVKIIKSFYMKYFDKMLQTSTNLKIFLVTMIFLVLGIMFSYNYDFLFSVVFVFLSFILLINLFQISKIINEIKSKKTYEAKKSFINNFCYSTYNDLEDLSNHMNKIYEDGAKAQRVKTELITNVSHDLRTPLTSIIGFVDLLSKKSDNYDDETKEYIKILSEKSERMSIMVKDLFELSKTVSGDINIEMNRLSVKKLIEQILNELDDVIDKEKIFTTFDESLHINGDGDKIYRVIQNLIENAIKYSLEGTNIYIDTYLSGEKVIIEFKNIANYKMNFTPEEIVERFYRGDESRTKDGNGLGLSIAKTYTNINNGDFSVKIDGDLFKVILAFDRID